ncbi:MAG TPA: hypothetical protein VL426_01090 [Candidatus Binatia bacterium]|jgi:hypothetical protein|nr:hypothetical protein [Candidatus Binatia bacterium]
MKKAAILKTIGMSAALLLLAAPVLAAPDLGFGYAQGIGLPVDIDIRGIVANLIRTLLGFLGILLVVQIMWGGFLMMTHGGNEEKRAEAVAVIRNSIIGLVIIMSSASIAKFVVDAVANASGSIM